LNDKKKIREKRKREIRTAEKTPIRFISISVNSPGILNYGGMRRPSMSFPSRRAPKMAIILSNAKAMGPKSLCGIYAIPFRKAEISIHKKKARFYLGCSHRSISFHLDLLPPPSLLIFFFLFFSSNPRPNILISDLGGLVDAIKEATNMNLDILGSAFVPVAVTSESGFDGGRCWVWARGLESRLGSGWLDKAQSVAFERRGWSDSRAFVSEELKR
jgi:hypothetical protein